MKQSVVVGPPNSGFFIRFDLESEISIFQVHIKYATVDQHNSESFTSAAISQSHQNTTQKAIESRGKLKLKSWTIIITCLYSLMAYVKRLIRMSSLLDKVYYRTSGPEIASWVDYFRRIYRFVGLIRTIGLVRAVVRDLEPIFFDIFLLFYILLTRKF